MPPEIAVSPDGKHANKLPDNWLETERRQLQATVADMDIIFLSALLLGKKAPVLITADMVRSMRPGSCIIDISIDQGGNCEVTRPGEKTMVNGVIVNGCKNIPGLLPQSSTWMFANNIYNLLKYLTREGRINLDMSDEITASILISRDGRLVHAGALEAMGLK